MSNALEELLPDVEWTTFNIGFFGETNAGKSTVIEALIRGTGDRIGDGSKDFTRQMEHIEDNKESNGIVFLDMPGIEGDESTVKESIKLAVAQSHVVFYIHGNKIPEAPTLKRMREYLRDYARVFSLMNVRGKPSQYKDEDSRILLNEDDSKTFNISKSQFRQILGCQYNGGSAMNAYLGFLALGNPVRDDFVRQHENAISIFGSKWTILEFSEFKRLKNRIYYIMQEAPTILCVSNVYKILSLHQSLLTHILRDKKALDQLLKALIEESNRVIEGIEEDFQDCTDDVKKGVERILSSACGSIKRKVQSLLDAGEFNENEIRSAIQKMVDEKKKEIEENINERLEALKCDIEDRTNKYNDRLLSQIRFNVPDSDIDIDIKSILSELNIGIRYVIEKVLDIGSSIIGVVGAAVVNPLLAIPTAIVAAVRHVLNLFRYDPKKRLAKAKERACSEIDRAFTDIQQKSIKKLEEGLQGTRKELGRQVSDIRQIATNTKDFSRTMNDRLHTIEEQKTRISTNLVKHLYGNEIEASYIDLDLQTACVIGLKIDIEKVREDLRMDRLYHWESFGEFFESLDHRIEDNILVVSDSDEFMRRASSAFMCFFDFTAIRKERINAN